MLNLTKEQMLAEGFTLSQIASQLIKQLDTAKENYTPKAQPISRKAVGFKGSVEEGIFTVLSKNPGLSDVECIEKLHELDVELYEQERRQVSLKLMDMAKDGRLTRVKNRVFKYSIA